MQNIHMLEKIGQEKMCIPSELRGDKINDTLFWGGILILVLDQILAKFDVLHPRYGVLLH